MNIEKQYFAVIICLAVIVSSSVLRAETKASGSSDPCMAQEGNTDYPQVSISNGQVHAIAELPDAEKGYYRSTRFDWSGVIRCLSYKGHTYFSPWRPDHNPMGHDSISGPVEEFKPKDGALGYADAKAGDSFVKPGVGVLKKIDDAPYKFQTIYPVVDHGHWSYKAKKNEISFTHKLTSQVGYSYEYTKTIELAKGEPVMLLHHRLKNTGTKAIDTDVYDHDFYRLDENPTGPDMTVHFGFTPKPSREMQNGGMLNGSDLTYANELLERQTVSTNFSGFSDNVSDYDFKVENVKTGVGVEQTADHPIANVVFWSVRATIAPEAYIHLHVEPGASEDWTIKYRFFAK